MVQRQGTASTSQGASSPVDHHKYGVVLVGFEQASQLQDVLDKYPLQSNGFSVPIWVLEPDERRAVIAREHQSTGFSTRVRVHSGEHCVQEFITGCRDRLECIPPRHCIASGQHVMQLAQQVGEGLNSVVREQAIETRSLLTSILQRWSERGMSYWEDRYAQVLAGNRARVLIATTRFSTFVQHSSEDLVFAYQDIGHEASVLVEPDDHSMLTPLHCYRAIEKIDPDLFIVHNFPRCMRQEYFPAGFPYVCWVQDAMSHLFEKALAAPTQLDFLAGHIYSNAAGLVGYKSERALEFPVPVSGRKFFSEQVDSENQDRLGCDIAYVSHQSETVGDFYSKFRNQYREGLWEAIDLCRDEVLEAMGDWQSEPQLMRLRAINDKFVERLGRKGDHDLAQLTMSQFVNPLAERMIRHQTLEWAGEIAREHGLVMKIFGKGWDQHPTLSSFACGELSHDDELRACYQSAVVHLHASINGCGHQRVFECAQSGGLPLCRRSWDELYMQDWIQINEFMKKDLPKDVCLLGWKEPAYSIGNFPELQRAIDFRLKLKRPSGGWDHEAFEHVYAEFDTPNVHAVGDVPLQVYAHLPEREGFSYHDAPMPPRQLRPIETLGDPLDLTFSTKADLEDRILRAVSDKAWRDAESKKLALRVGERVSMSRFAQQLLEMVGNQLAGDHAVGEKCAQKRAQEGAV